MRLFNPDSIAVLLMCAVIKRTGTSLILFFAYSLEQFFQRISGLPSVKVPNVHLSQQLLDILLPGDRQKSDVTVRLIGNKSKS